MANISIKQLKVFVTITQHSTLTAASEALFLSKAAVSMALGEMEKQLGHSLFDRVNNRLILNQEGQKLLPLADEILHRATGIDVLFRDDQPLSGRLKVGASDTIGNQVAPFILAGFRERTQHKDQNLFISNSALICQKLIDYELDIALIEGKATHPELIASQCSGDEMCIIASHQHPLAAQNSMTLEDLEDSHWILRESGSGTREFFLRAVAPHIDNWYESFELNTTEAIINSVSAGLGLACLSRLSAQPAIGTGRVKAINVPLDMQRQFWMLVHKDKYQSPLLKAFMNYCEDWATQQD